MIKYPMTDIIAQRTFAISRPEGSQNLVLSIGKPALFPEDPNRNWYCPWMIDGPEELARKRYAGGVDGLQALLLAISMISVELRHLRLPGKLTWLDDEDLGLDLVRGAA